MLRIGQRGVVAEMQQSLVSHLAALGQQPSWDVRSTGVEKDLSSAGG